MSKETPSCPHCGCTEEHALSYGYWKCQTLIRDPKIQGEPCKIAVLQHQLRQAHAALRQIADKWVPRPPLFASPDPDDCYEYASIASDMQDIAKEALASAPDGKGEG